MSDSVAGQPPYAVFGLRVSSPFALWHGVPSSAEPDLVVELGGSTSPDEPEPASPSIDLVRSPIEFSFPRVARYRVDSGRTITVIPEPEADAGLLALVTRGIGIGVALHQRGRVLLHGSCFGMNGLGVCVVGPSGTGKSTILARMMARGATFVSDAVTVLEEHAGTFRALVGPPEVHFWPDAIESLGESPERFRPMSSQWDKRSFPARGEIAAEPVPLHRILVLEDGDGEEISDFAPSDRLFQLVKNAYLAPNVTASSHAVLLQRMAPVASAVVVRRVRRRRSIEHLDSLLDAIERDAASPPSPIPAEARPDRHHT